LHQPGPQRGKLDADDHKDLFKNNSALLQPTHGGARRGLIT